MGNAIVKRYETDIPEVFSDFDPKAFTDGALEWADRTVGKKDIVALSASGGVDSTTAAYLLKDALGKRLHLFFINDGLRRTIGGRPEKDVTADMFRDFPNFEVVDNSALCLLALDGVDFKKRRGAFRTVYSNISNEYMSDMVLIG